MAKAVDIRGHHYWILSEPERDTWNARVVEHRADGSNLEVGIAAHGVTRTAADEAAERKLRRLLRAC